MHIEPGPVVQQLQPTTEQVIQAEPDYVDNPLSSLPVVVEQIKGPVRTQALPRKAGSTRTRNAPFGDPIRVLGLDPRRASVKLVGYDDDFLFAFTEANAQTPRTMSRWPKGIPYECTATTEVWIAGNTMDTDVSITVELWAEG